MLTFVLLKLNCHLSLFTASQHASMPSQCQDQEKGRRVSPTAVVSGYAFSYASLVLGLKPLNPAAIDPTVPALVSRLLPLF